MITTAVRGDITSLRTEAIVNAANSTLLGGGGVDGAIHRAAGPELLEECRRLNGCPTGEARLTSGYKLPANYIIHTVGPVWSGGSANEAEELSACYRNCLDLASRHQIYSIAFPAISCGAYGYPLDKAAKIAVDTINSWRQSNRSYIDVTFCLFGEKEYKLYNDLIEHHRSSITLSGEDRIVGAVSGLVISEALALPAELYPREQFRKTPFLEPGKLESSHPPGSWSDLSSLFLCTVQSLLETNGDLHDMMKKIDLWEKEGYLGSGDSNQHIGPATAEALEKFRRGLPREDWGSPHDWQNGAAGTIRSLPLALFCINDHEGKALEKMRLCIELTHAHERSVFAGFFLTLLSRSIFRGETLETALEQARTHLSAYISDNEKPHFENILERDLKNTPIEKINSSSYILHSIEASLHCLLNSRSLLEAVLRAINLGDATTCTASLSGFLGGLMFGHEAIPLKWKDYLRESDMILSMAERLAIKTLRDKNP